MADLFCGAGGSSTGATRAIRALGGEIDLVAINHWDVAIATHSRNHPEARHACVNLDAARPEEFVPEGHLDLLMASPECFPAGTLILAERGLVPIEDIDIGDRVLTHRNRWMPVLAVSSAVKPTVRISTPSHFGLETTAEHPFLARRRFMKHRPEDGSRFRYSEPEWVRASELRDHTMMVATPTIAEPLPIPPVGGRGANFCPEFWWMVGRWLADGTVRLDDDHAEITISCGKHRADELETGLHFAEPVGNRAGRGEYRWRRRDVRTATLFETGHLGLCEWLLAHFGKLAHGKTVPAWALSLPIADRRALLDGYTSADGCISEGKMLTATVSRRLAIGIRLLAESLGHRATLRHIAARGHPIEGRVVHDRDQWHVSWTLNPQREDAVEINGHSWRRVRSVKPAQGSATVYNLQVAEDESYVADGLVVHNCVFFSRARGGKPVSDQRRMSAWHVQRWASALTIDRILVENVPEFVTWGPLTRDGRPDPDRKGTYFQAWVQALWSLGYEVDWRLLNAADFGDATTRVRFFLQARRDGRPIRWPEPTHSPTGQADLMGTRPRWRAAREIIDWDNPGASLFERKRTLSIKTRLRIARGLQRFGGSLAPLYIRLLDLPADQEAKLTHKVAKGRPVPFVVTGRENNVPKSVEEPLGTITTIPAIYVAEPVAEPFVLGQQSNSAARSADNPIPTVATAGRIALVQPSAEPFVIANRNNATPKGADEPIPTATTSTGGGICLVEPTAAPFVLGQQSGSVARSANSPLPTIATVGAISIVAPTLVPYYGASESAQSVDRPLPTVTTRARFGLCSPLVVPYGPRAEARSVDDPLPTILTRDRLGVAEPVVEPFLVPQFGEAPGQAPRVHAIDEPLPAVTSHGAGALVEPSLEPAATAIDPRRLVFVDGVLCQLDIRFRMLRNDELARAMGFDTPELEYQFVGTIRDVTTQIGNAVPVHLAEALVGAALAE